jgi:antitoxin (DNA-binding transcriptional repressor) of toxin-antitoxin stability system
MRWRYHVAMMSVNIAALKNRLSHYLRLVRRGEPVLVRDRDRIIARIEPLLDPGAAAGDEERRIADLEARGILRRPERKLDRRWLDRAPEVHADLVAALLREREEGP